MLHLDIPSFRAGQLLVCKDGAPLCDLDRDNYPPVLDVEDKDEYDSLCDAVDKGEGEIWAVEPGRERTPWNSFIERQSGEVKDAAEVTHWIYGCSTTDLSLSELEVPPENVETKKPSSPGYTPAILFERVYYLLDAK